MRLSIIVLVVALLTGPAVAAEAVRFASFNAALTEDEAGALARRLAGGGDGAARRVAETIQRVRPDVLALQEIDRDEDGEALAIFLREYLAVPQNGAEPVLYPHVLHPPSNTGVPTGVDVDGDGAVGGPGDARGFGRHRGQYAFALLSRLPLGEARTFADLLWRDVPGSLMPADYYSQAAMAVMPLSSKTHLAVPVATPFGEVWVLAAHPTPPVFDDARDWNGRRNADEIRLLAAMLDPAGGGFLVDDAGRAGGIPEGAEAVVLGDLNADPDRGDSRPGAIERRSTHRAPGWTPCDVVPAATVTADFSIGRDAVDYVLPTGRARREGGRASLWPGVRTIRSPALQRGERTNASCGWTSPPPFERRPLSAARLSRLSTPRTRSSKAMLACDRAHPRLRAPRRTRLPWRPRACCSRRYHVEARPCRP